MEKRLNNHPDLKSFKFLWIKIMIKTRFLYILFVFLLPNSAYACFCGYLGVVKNYQESEFVATAKIIKISPDPKNSEYHDAIIEIITLYKGELLSNIKIASSLNTSCAFLPKENSTWLIFAQRWNGTLGFGSCSGSMRIDETFDLIAHPDANKNYGNSIKLKESAISFLSENHIFNPNPAGLWAINEEMRSFKGYKNMNRFAVFQVDVNPDLSIDDIKQLKKFQNKKLNRLVFHSMKKSLTFKALRGKPLTKPARVVVFCFFYEPVDQFASSLSFLDF